MFTARVAGIRKKASIPACLSMAVWTALGPAPAAADEPAPSPHPGIGGHVGVALPLVTLSDETTTIGDNFTLAFPIGIGFKLSEKVAIDFETVVNNPVSPRGTTSLVVDPGIVYDMGSFVIGLRLAWKVQADTNFGVIPLIHKGIANIGGGANWFVEAAFPTFVSVGADPGDVNGDKTTAELNVVFHTGVGF